MRFDVSVCVAVAGGPILCFACTVVGANLASQRRHIQWQVILAQRSLDKFNLSDQKF